MRHRSRPLASLALAVCALPLVGAGEAGVTVTVKVTDIRNAKGVVRACMTMDAARFPRCQGNPEAHRAVTDTVAGGVTFTFNNVKPGRYAIALLHDENSNGKADRMLGMMPKEGYGFSRDAPVKMAPPKFEEAAFDVGATAQALTIRMRYWL